MDLSSRNIRVALSNSCNMNCNYCDWPSKNRPEDKPWAMEDYRSKNLSYWNITTDTYKEIIKILNNTWFWWIALTWWEPFLNNDWDKIADYSREIWMQRVNITTNWMLLEKYIKENWKLPNSLTLLNISLDTYNPEYFNYITWWVWKLDKVINWLKLAKITNPSLKIRANKVWLKSSVSGLIDYIKFCENIWVIDEINLLSLIRKSDNDNKFFEKEYISAEKIISILKDSWIIDYYLDERQEYRLKSKKWLEIIIKDTNLTMRTKDCDSCELYCQEWFYTVRVATDGTIMTCPDYSSKKAAIDIVNASENINNPDLLTNKIQKLVDVLLWAKVENTMDKFVKFHWININY